ncbi:hypothetical protein AAFC00_006004 [Neodothiora populina]|uniref:Major facilitator superfamily (MFS) profile domain-containing protein n=1 Tax=Neodothiora populina TaxID=2781224 RepID=A0ABR3P6Y2_9PEZI
MGPESIELETHAYDAESRDTSTEAEGQDTFSLPPADGGKDAWLFLTSAFVLEALVWGFPFSFGVFQTYYASHEPFMADGNGIAAIGTTATGMMYFLAPIVYAVLRMYPRYRRTSTMVGFVIMLGSFIAASFANTVTQLIGTQGVMYAFGGALCYFPTLAYLDEWFVQRKGIAFGVICAGGGAAGLAIPFVMEWVLNSYGFRTALRVWAIVVVVLTTPILYHNKGRLPVRPHTSSAPQRIEWRFVKTAPFWILQVASIVQGLGYFLPSIYITSYALSVGLTRTDGTLAVALINAATVIGAIVSGFLADKYHVTTAILVSCIGSVVAVFLFWSFAVYRSIFFIFAVLYGIFAGGFSSTWAGCAKPLRLSYPGTETGMVIAVFSAGKGIGSVISGPLSEALVAADSSKDKAAFAFGSGYGTLLIFTGVTAAFTGTTWCGRRFGFL